MKVGECCSPTFYVVEGGKHMKCLRKYKWVKLPRMHLPSGKGLMGYWAKLASRAAFRKGNAVYCGHINPVTAGMWSGGVVGLKSILGVKKRVQVDVGFLISKKPTKNQRCKLSHNFSIYDKLSNKIRRPFFPFSGAFLGRKRDEGLRYCNLSQKTRNYPISMR